MCFIFNFYFNIQIWPVVWLCLAHQYYTANVPLFEQIPECRAGILARQLRQNINLF